MQTDVDKYFKNFKCLIELIQSFAFEPKDIFVV